MLTKKIVVGKIEILEDGQIQLRTDTVILENGTELSRLYHRQVLEPGQDTTAFEKRLQDVCTVVWTPETVATYRAKKARKLVP